MIPWGCLLSLGVFGASFIMTMLLARAAKSTGLIDVPNERSSHSVPTPRGGGLAIVISSLAALAVLAVWGRLPSRILIGLGGGGITVAGIGFLDDRGSLSPGTRLLVHFVAAAWAVVWVGQLRELRIGTELVQLGIAGYVISTVAIVWFLNIFNFMDGIDGIAASEAMFICGAALLLSAISGGTGETALAASAVGAASAGFLAWNWPPARIFMGDVGSGYLGFVIGVLALANIARNPAYLWTWLIIAGVFVVDSSITLVRRILRGERITLAHRTHAYQHLARRLGHTVVTASIAVIDLAWLLPCAILSAKKPQYGFWVTLLALCPLAMCALAVGAGRPELAERTS